MAEEIVTILNVKTGEAVSSIAELKENIKALKEGFEDAQGNMQKGLNNLEIGTDEYKETLEALKVNQNALKDAMYATTGKMEDLAAAATGASTSYNSLVNKMAELKRQFRSTTDEVERAKLGTRINLLNSELKRLDELQGNFQRNVGNYQSAFKGLGDHIDAFRKGLGAATGGLRGMKDGAEALAKSPAIATFTILVSLVMKLADAVKEDEKATASLKKGLDALQPVMDFLSGILDKVVDFLVEIIDKVSAFLGSSGLINKVIQGVMGVGNAVLKFVVSPFKGVIEAIKIFKEQGVKGLGNAARAFTDEMQNGFAFKENFKAGQLAADAMLSGASSRKKKVEETGKKLGEDAGKAFAEGMYKKALEALKLNDAWKQALKEWGENLADAQEELDDELQAEIDASFQAEVESLKNALKEEEDARQKDLEKTKAITEAKKKLLQSVAKNTSSILGSIADMYEADSENAEKNANKIKNLRIAAATIDTISGAIGAFMQASETIPPPYGQIVGAIEAAAITAAGIAQIAQMKATNVSTEGGSRPTISAMASAPALQPNVTNVRTVTSASEEDRLNQMAKEQRVYILASDIQASQDQIKTQVEESSF